MRLKGSSGFTLIEIMVAVALVAVLASIAIPSYSAYVVRGQRAAAKVALEQAAQFLERNYTTSGCYNYTDALSCGNQGGNAVAWPFKGAPTDGGAVTYAMPAPLVWTDPASAAPAAGQYFLLTAAPCGGGGCPAGSNTSFTDAQCGTLLLDSAGQKGINVTGTNDFTPAAVGTCWQR